MVDITDEMRRVQEEIEQIFSNFYTIRKLLPGKSEKGLEKAGARMPVADAYETENSIVAVVELPGVNKQDIKLNITDDIIEVKAEKKQEKEQKGKRFYSYAAASSSFYRKLSLPAQVKPEEAKAEYKNGLLRIEIPKAKKKNVDKKRRIEIE